MCLAARRPRRTRKVILIARSASFSFSLMLVSSSIALEDRPAQRDRCASAAAAPPLLRLAAPLSPPARLARPFSLWVWVRLSSTQRLRSSCVCVWPAAAWPLGGLPSAVSAVCGCSNATDGGTADRAQASRLAPCTRRSRSGRKTACCLVLADDLIFFLAHSHARVRAHVSLRCCLLLARTSGRGCPHEQGGISYLEMVRVLRSSGNSRKFQEVSGSFRKFQEIPASPIKFQLRRLNPSSSHETFQELSAFSCS